LQTDILIINLIGQKDEFDLNLEKSKSEKNALKEFQNSLKNSKKFLEKFLLKNSALIYICPPNFRR
jgi:hypothetical protein